MISHSSTKSSSRLGETTRLCSNHQWPILSNSNSIRRGTTIHNRSHPRAIQLMDKFQPATPQDNSRMRRRPIFLLPQQQQQQPPPQHDPQQRFFSPAPPSEPLPPPGYAASPYVPPNGPTPPQQQNGPAAFHFIPGGVQAPPDPSLAVRRKPSPQAAVGQQPAQAPPSEMGAAPSGQMYSGQSVFQGQIRPNSIHTLNSGNPQELATGGYESPVDNRRSYPPAGPPGTTQAQQPPQQTQQPPHYDGYAQSQQTGHVDYAHQPHPQVGGGGGRTGQLDATARRRWRRLEFLTEPAAHTIF